MHPENRKTSNPEEMVGEKTIRGERGGLEGQTVEDGLETECILSFYRVRGRSVGLLHCESDTCLSKCE